MKTESNIGRLDAVKHEIRVLEIVPAFDDNTDVIQCNREIVSIQSFKNGFAQTIDRSREARLSIVKTLWIDNTYDKDDRIRQSEDRFEWGDFVALSYTWGDPADQETIILDGIPTKIQETLASALRALRAKQPIRSGWRVWADALCINQTDIAERNEHVQRMGDVYDKARHVVSWLGNESYNSSRAFLLITEVAEEWSRSDGDRWKFSLHQRPDLLDPQAWLALFDFMDRRYWSRVWVKQELAMGKLDTVLMCGKDAVAWSQLHDTIWLAAYSSLAYIETMVRQEASKRNSDLTTDMSLDPLKRLQIYQLSTLQRKLEEPGDTPTKDAMLIHRLAASLDLSQWSQATDDRDKVYGILSLLPTTIASLVQVDYTLTAEQVYASFAKAVILGSQNLDILDHCSWKPNQEIPSWVPDWRATEYSRIFGGIKRKKPYNASRGQPANVTFRNENAWLKVRGFQVDVIDGLGCASSDSTIAESDKNMFQAESSHPVHVSNVNSKVHDALWRTYTGNISTDGEAAPDSFGQILDLVKHGNQTNGVHIVQQSSLRRLEFLINLNARNANLLVAGISIEVHIRQWSSSDIAELQSNNLLDAALERVYRCAHTRRLAVTAQGYLCMVPNASLPGDRICVLFGCSLPVVLRSHENSNKFILIGTCYCHGISQGELIDQVHDGRLVTEDFVIT